MKTQKRDKSERAYVKGYQIGSSGRSQELCPHATEIARQAWMSGWRQGRIDQWEGFTSVSSVSSHGKVSHW